MDYEPRIGSITKDLMIGTALLFDVVGLLSIPISVISGVGTALAFVFSTGVFVTAWCIFFIWFKMKDVSFFERFIGARGGKFLPRILLFLGIMSEAVVPFFPGWLVMTYITVKYVQRKDKLVREGRVSKEEIELLEEEGLSISTMRELMRIRAARKARVRREQEARHEEARIARIEARGVYATEGDVRGATRLVHDIRKRGVVEAT